MRTEDTPDEIKALVESVRVPRGAGAAVDGDEVRSGGEGHGEVGLDVAGGELDADRLAAGRVAEVESRNADGFPEFPFLSKA